MSKYLKFTGDSLRQQFEDNYKFEFYGEEYQLPTATHKTILFNKYKIKGGFFCLI